MAKKRPYDEPRQCDRCGVNLGLLVGEVADCPIVWCRTCSEPVRKAMRSLRAAKRNRRPISLGVLMP